MWFIPTTLSAQYWEIIIVSVQLLNTTPKESRKAGHMLTADGELPAGSQTLKSTKEAREGGRSGYPSRWGWGGVGRLFSLLIIQCHILNDPNKETLSAIWL